MEIVGPVIGICAIIMIAAAGIVMVRLFTAKISQLEAKSRVTEPTGRDQMLEDVQVRLGELEQLQQRMGELEERVDFAERLLAARHEPQQLGPSQDAG